MAATGEEILRQGSDTLRRANLRFGIFLDLLLGRWGGNNGVRGMRGSQCSIEQRGDTDYQKLGSPIPGGVQVARALGEQ